MSPTELQWRLGAALRNTAQRTLAQLHAPAWDRRRLGSVLGSGAGMNEVRRALSTEDWSGAHASLGAMFASAPARFVIAPVMRDDVVARIAAAWPGAARDAAARAERIAAGEFDLLGYRGLRFDAAGSPAPDWFVDPVHNARAPRAFWSTVPFLDPAHGDHKIVWELNRHQHLLALGRAYWLTGDARCRDLAVSHLTNWIKANPPLVGINWASMLELGFRTVSWVWAIHFFAGDSDHDREPWLVDLFVALDRQLLHIEQNLSHYFSPNTHLLGEALALYLAGRSLPMLASAERFAAVGRRVLIAELSRQVGRDGGHLERSTHYHRYTLDFYVLALAVARITGDAAVVEFDSAVGRLGAAARLLADDHGRLPHLGDDDGGMLLPICGRAPDDVRDSLAVASALVDAPDLRVGDIPEEAHWMLAHPTLAPHLDRLSAVPPGTAPRSAALPDTGYYVSRSAEGHHLVVDAGPHGYENGGHAHADALSMTLSVRGVPMLIDSGTGSYTIDPHARDTFRSSMMHNTVTVDGRSQSLPAGPFHWAHAAQARAHIWRTNPGFDYLEASHDGYAPLEHRRHVLALHGDLLLVADLVSGDGVHQVDQHWHFDPRWSVELSGQRALLRSGGDRVQLAVSRGAIEHVRGGPAPGVGWHAPVYGRVERTSAVRVSDGGAAPLWIVTAFGLNPDNEVLAVTPIALRAPAGTLERSVAVTVSRAHSTDLFALGAPGLAGHPGRATWLVAGYETDARMLFCRTTDRISRLALVDGSFVRAVDDRSLLVKLAADVPDLHLDFPRRDRRAQPARIGGPALGPQVHFGGLDLPVASERRALARVGRV
ncbi:MAG TPA: alginate lyase family protein [Vicinamibacterales bacterium]|nr:alginate lyase family protein [Vicinamibacterales bacterium]